MDPAEGDSAAGGYELELVAGYHPGLPIKWAIRLEPVSHQRLDQRARLGRTGDLQGHLGCIDTDLE